MRRPGRGPWEPQPQKPRLARGPECCHSVQKREREAEPRRLHGNVPMVGFAPGRLASTGPASGGRARAASPAVGPRTGSPACPMGRGRVRRLPPVPPAWAWSGQGLSLWRKQRGVCRVEKMPQAETSREQEMARGQVPGLRALGRTCTALGGSKLQMEATGGPGTRCRC